MSRAQSPIRDETLHMNIVMDKLLEVTDAVRELKIQVNEIRNGSTTNPQQKPSEQHVTISEPSITSYKLALHLIPEFDGSNVESFIEHIQAAIKRLANDQLELLLISVIAQKLTGRTKGTVRLDGIQTFPHLFEKLRFLYGKAQNLSALEVQRDTCFQRINEGIDDFINRFSRIQDEIVAAINSQSTSYTKILIQEEIYQQKAIEVFRRNVRTEISDHLYSFDNLDTLNLAFGKARMFEGELQLRRMRTQRSENYKRPASQKPQFHKKECSYCKRYGHEEKECRTKVFHQQRNQQQNFRERQIIGQPPGPPSRRSLAIEQNETQLSSRTSFDKDQEEHTPGHHELD